MIKKRALRDEHREDWKIGRRREVGRTPNWVYQQRKEARKGRGE